MCRNIIPLLIWVLTTVPLSAQIPVIAEQHFFQPGRCYPYRSASFLNQSPGSGGAEITWDFSQLVFPRSADTTESVIPSTTPAFLRCGISGTDTATICLVNRSNATYRNDDYHYYCKNAGKITETGSDQDNGLNEDVNFQFFRTRTFLMLPFTYGMACADSFNGTYFSYLSGPHTLSGVDSFIVDGYGTLKVAGTIYNNCVRIKQVTHQADSNGILGKNISSSVRYTWYSTDKEGPVLIMEPYVSNGVTAHYYFPEQEPSGIRDIRTDLFVLYPNPAGDKLFVRYKTSSVLPLQLILLNTLGQVVLTTTLCGEQDFIDISGLAEGAYYCQVYDKAGTYCIIPFIRQ